MQLKVLVAEDDANTRSALQELLSREGHQVTAAADGHQALFYWQRQSFDLVCLDVMMPGHSGYDLCRQFRIRDPRIPILFITAKGEEIDKVVGLELGADDYLVKPFGTQELLARIRAVTRRSLGGQPVGSVTAELQGDDFQMGDLHITPRSLRATRRESTDAAEPAMTADRVDVAIDLTHRELKILRLLWQQRGAVVTRDEIGRTAWDQGHVPGSRTLDQTISQLRKRIEQDPQDPKIIQTVYGVGYRFE